MLSVLIFSRYLFCRGEAHKALLWLMCDLVYRSIAAKRGRRGLEVKIPDQKHDEDAQLHLGKFPTWRTGNVWSASKV
jgi:hypothetical protein